MCDEARLLAPAEWPVSDRPLAGAPAHLVMKSRLKDPRADVQGLLIADNNVIHGSNTGGFAGAGQLSGGSG
jgi:hypothetical protein